MLDTLRMLIADSLPSVPDLDPPIHPGDIRVAACALLLEIAHADKQLSRDERVVIERSLVTYFGVDERGALELMAEAERQLATQTDDASFTRQVIAEYDEDQRHVLSDLIWDVANAGGWLGEHEALLATRLEQWLGVRRGPRPDVDLTE
ncbi:TerB family tellurite resistance protein [Gemmatimonas sp.]|uniref:tellurite resistance TerB family protein n=1 Tax=Gemmatimonas sp. TaxID=1962908 RepID=UPI003342A165